MHKYTKKEQGFMEKYVPGHSHREIQEAFTQKFGWDISLMQVRGYIKNHHLSTGRTGRFGPGHVPPNKGKKGVCPKGSEKTQFKKGHAPANHRPVGSERINRDGYVEVKVAEPDRWRLKHRAVWEAVHGEIPEGHAVIFKDNDKTNTDIGNLLLVSRGTLAVLNHTGLCNYTGEFKETAVRIAELKTAMSKARGRKAAAGKNESKSGGG